MSDLVLGATNAEEPFKSGERIAFSGDQYTVVKNHGNTGTVVEFPSGDGPLAFRWSFEGEECRRVIDGAASELQRLRGALEAILARTNGTSFGMGQAVAKLATDALDGVPEQRSSEGRRYKTSAEIVAVCNKLARMYYASQGYEVEEGYRFDRAHHPHERGMWNQAALAFEFIEGTDVENALCELEDEEDERG